MDYPKARWIEPGDHRCDGCGVAYHAGDLAVRYVTDGDARPIIRCADRCLDKLPAGALELAGPKEKR